MKKTHGIWGLALMVGVLFSFPARALLIDRGNGLIYDTVLDITWLQDANAGAGSAFDNGSNTNDGFMSWPNARDWAQNLVFQGFDDWRLASMSVSSGLPTGSAASIVNCATATEVACRDNELGYMFYHNLDGTLGMNLTGNQTTANGVQLNNIQQVYWSGTERTPPSPPPTPAAWGLGFLQGGQDFRFKGNFLAAWAVRPGDVLSVPEPATGLLLAAGLVGLGWSRRRLRSIQR